MEIHFDIVRIGRFRKVKFTEKILAENLKYFMSSIRKVLQDFSESEQHIVLVIPAKGTNIKMALQDVKSVKIKSVLRKEFPNRIFKSDYSLLLDNLENPIFSRF